MVKIKGKFYGEPENSELKTGWVGVVQEDSQNVFPEGTEVRVKNDNSLVNDDNSPGPLVIEFNGEVFLVEEEKQPEPCPDEPGYEVRCLRLKHAPH